MTDQDWRWHALEALGDGVLLLTWGAGREVQVADANRAALAMLGQPDARGRALATVLAHCTEQGVIARAQACLAGEQPGRLLFHQPTADGQACYRELCLHPLGDARAIAVLRDITLLEQQSLQVESLQRQLGEQAIRDPLTGLASRQHGMEQVASLWALHQRLQQDMAVVCVDIDGFKRFNDHHGHAEGDAVLRSVGTLLSRHFARRTDVVGRVAGDEFLIAASMAEPAEHLETRLDECREAIAQRHGTEGDSAVTVSMGMCVGMPSAHATLAAFMRMADHARYQARHRGGNRVVRVAV